MCLETLKLCTGLPDFIVLQIFQYTRHPVAEIVSNHYGKKLDINLKDYKCKDVEYNASFTRTSWLELANISVKNNFNRISQIPHLESLYSRMTELPDLDKTKILINKAQFIILANIYGIDNEWINTKIRYHKKKTVIHSIRICESGIILSRMGYKGSDHFTTIQNNSESLCFDTSPGFIFCKKYRGKLWLYKALPNDTNSKEQLLELCDGLGINAGKRWTKRQILDKIYPNL
tara:strand:+ start:994 stop:1689 length:696 start_codon:yes stop_codon:yes gene_type:complete